MEKITPVKGDALPQRGDILRSLANPNSGDLKLYKVEREGGGCKFFCKNIGRRGVARSGEEQTIIGRFGIYSYGVVTVSPLDSEQCSENEQAA